MCCWAEIITEAELERFKVQGSVFGVPRSKFEVWGLTFAVPGYWFPVQFKVHGSWFRMGRAGYGVCLHTA